MAQAQSISVLKITLNFLLHSTPTVHIIVQAIITSFCILHSCISHLSNYLKNISSCHYIASFSVMLHFQWCSITYWIKSRILYCFYSNLFPLTNTPLVLKLSWTSHLFSEAFTLKLSELYYTEWSVKVSFFYSFHFKHTDKDTYRKLFLSLLSNC